MGNTETKKASVFSGIVNKIVTFFKGVKTEFKKIIWPSRDTLLKQLFAVLVVAIILGAVIALLDFGFQSLFDFLMGITIGE